MHKKQKMMHSSSNRENPNGRVPGKESSGTIEDMSKSSEEFKMLKGLKGPLSKLSYT